MHVHANQNTAKVIDLLEKITPNFSGCKLRDYTFGLVVLPRIIPILMHPIL